MEKMLTKEAAGNPMRASFKHDTSRRKSHGEDLLEPLPGFTTHNVFVGVHGFYQMIENRVLHGRIFDARRIVRCLSLTICLVSSSAFYYLFGFFILVLIFFFFFFG